MQARGRLIRCFPGPAISVLPERILDATFRQALVQCIIKLESEAIEEACPITIKAGKDHEETRDTRHPKFVTEMLMGILRGIGHPTDVTRIYKHTRDDVLWDRALLPWRRSVPWTLLRVAMQTTLMHRETHSRYKSFMIFLLARMLEMALKASFASDMLFVMITKINRRILKLGIAAELIPGLAYIQKIVIHGHSVLQKRWKSLQYPVAKLQTIWSQLDLDRDSLLSLQDLSCYLENVMSRRPLNPKARGVVIVCTHRVKQTPCMVYVSLKPFSWKNIKQI